MLPEPHPKNTERLDVLRAFDVLDSSPEKTYDELTQLTADLCEAPVCLVSLVEEDRQWFKSEVGLGICETKIEQSICAHAVVLDDYLEIEDTQLDDRTKDNSLCLGERPFRFYAGAIIRSLSGWPLGTLCVLDYKPRRLTELQTQVLTTHARSVSHQLELTRTLVQQVRLGASASQINKNSKHQAKLRTLTPRETEIVDLIISKSGSLSSKEIGRHLNISHRTVDHHRASIKSKMQVDSVAELLSEILRNR